MPHLTNNPCAVLPIPEQDAPPDWSTLLGRASTPTDPTTLAAPFAGKRILITGAGGSIGSALAKRVALFQPEHLTLLDSAEHGLYEIQNHLASFTGITTIIPGDVCDSALLREIFAIHRPHIVYHAAAYKHVPLMEHHPLAALQTNALGTYTLAEACIEADVEQFILLSTDKAVSPSSIMGASKKVAELVLLARQDHAAQIQGHTTQMKALRLGNVLGSRGSVVPLFMHQIAQGGPITVTHPEIRRYFLSLPESIELLLSLAQPHYSQGIFIPRIGEPIRILDLAHFLIETAPPATASTIPIVFTGLRPGEKMQEELLSANEFVGDATEGPLPLRKVNGPQPAAADILHALDQLKQAVHARATDRALQILHRLVPEYQPSDLIRHHLTHPVATQ